LVNLPLISIIYITELYHKSDTPFSSLAFIFLGIVYITVRLYFSSVVLLVFNDKLYHPEIILVIWFLLWANDTGAFITGSLLG